MPERMSEERRQEIRERAEKATPGPWYTLERPWVSALDAGLVVQAGDPDPHIARMVADCDTVDSEDPVTEVDADDQNEQDTHNARFVAHARTDVPALLAALDAAEREIERLRGLCCPMHCDLCEQERTQQP